jgi:hypothetical protein
MSYGFVSKRLPRMPKPASVLKFDMMNDGDLHVTDVRIRIAIVQKERSAADRTPPRVIVVPFTISGHAAIEAGHTVNWEMLLRNLSSDCQCHPRRPRRLSASAHGARALIPGVHGRCSRLSFSRS